MPALDENLFTLKFKRSETEPNTLDLVDPRGQLYYRKRPVPPNHRGEPVGESGAPLYDLWDPLSDSLLATLLANPQTFNKKRAVQLYNPNAIVDVNFVGTINFKWQFQWEDHIFEFRRDECMLIRKPDPPVRVAVYDFDRKRDKTEVGLFQLMDFNLRRFDIDDRKGLEIVMIAGMLSFQDSITGHQLEIPQSNVIPPLGRIPSNSAPPPIVMSPMQTTPPLEIGMQVSGLQIRENADPNEVIVTSMFDIEEYADYAVNLLRDPKMLFIVIRSKTAAEVPKVVAIASNVKRLHYKGGGYDEDLHQYAKYEEEEKKGPRVIRLDGPQKEAPKEYQPPKALSIHLSKIVLPDLAPRIPGSSATIASGSRPTLNVPQSSGGRGRSHSADTRPSGKSAGRDDRRKEEDTRHPAVLSKNKQKNGKGRIASESSSQVPSNSQPMYPGGYTPGRPSSANRPPAASMPRPTPSPQPAPSLPPREERSTASFWPGGFGRSKPSTAPSQQQPALNARPSPEQQMPGSYFPQPGRPVATPVPQTAPSQPQPDGQQQAGGAGGFSSYFGNLVTAHTGNSNPGVTDMARLVGNLGLSTYERFAGGRK